MKASGPWSFKALVQTSILGRTVLWECEKQPSFYCTHYMSSLQTNHVLEIEPEEDCWAWILLCSSSPPPWFFPFFFFPSFSHAHIVLPLYLSPICNPSFLFTYLCPRLLLAFFYFSSLLLSLSLLCVILFSLSLWHFTLTTEPRKSAPSPLHWIVFSQTKKWIFNLTGCH